MARRPFPRPPAKDTIGHVRGNGLSLRKCNPLLQNLRVRMSNGPSTTPASEMPAAFFEDIRFFLNPDNQGLVQEARKQLGAYLGATSEAGQFRLENELAVRASSTQPTVRRIFRMLVFLNSGLPSEAGIDHTAVSAKMSEAIQAMAQGRPALQLSPDEFGRLQTIIAELSQESESIKQTTEATYIVRGVLPMFEELRATVELRSLQWPLDPNTSDDEQSFALVPVASLSLQLDSGDPPVVNFQATEKDLAALLDKIQRLQTALANLKKMAATLKPNA